MIQNSRFRINNRAIVDIPFSIWNSESGIRDHRGFTIQKRPNREVTGHASERRTAGPAGSIDPGLPMTRRAMFCRIGGGFGALGLGSVLADAGWWADPGRRRGAGRREASVPANPLAPRPPHFPARAKRVIFLFMNGGPSHVDTFDPKPALDEVRRPGPARFAWSTGAAQDAARSCPRRSRHDRTARAASRSPSSSRTSPAASTTSA